MFETTPKLYLISLFLLAIRHKYSQASFLEQSTCNKPQDCYVIPGVLELPCYYNINKCNCRQTIRSIHRLESNADGECQMSKYGPCGSNGPNLKVGCLDGFKCINGQCRDPKIDFSVLIPPPESPYVFESSSCSRGGGCGLGDQLGLSCGRNDKCVCEEVVIEDTAGPIWDVRNYDGNLNCSVGKFGPCGSEDGIKVDCHGPGIGCVNGRCIDVQNPISSLGGSCEIDTDCAESLVCSGRHKCIKLKSLGRYEVCNRDDECSGNLRCQIDPNDEFYEYDISLYCL